MQQDNTGPLTDMVKQIMPDQYDSGESLMDNAYRFTGYDRPSMEETPIIPDNSLANVGPDGKFASDPEAVSTHELIEEAYRNHMATEDERSEIIPAAVKAYVSTENFGDNIGTMIQVESAYLGQKLGSDLFSRFFGSDIQFGINAFSNRGGIAGMYADVVMPEEMYGPNWKDLSREQLYQKKREFHASQVEQYYDGVVDNDIGENVGMIGSHILDTANLAPTGYVRAVALGAKAGMGKTAASVAAGGAVGAAWGAAATTLDHYIQSEAMDSKTLLSHALFAGGVGALLPLVGNALNKIVRRGSETGHALSLEDVTSKINQSVDELQKMKDEVVKLPVQQGDKAKEEAASILQELNDRIDAHAKLDPVLLQRTFNDKMRKGAEADAADFIDTALRMHNGKGIKELKALQIFDSLYRDTPEKSIASIKNGETYKKLDDESRAIVDAHLAKRAGEEVPGKPPKKMTKAEEEAQVEAYSQKAMEETDEMMRTIGAHSKAYTSDVLRQVRNSGGGAAIGYGGAYVVTDDPEFAMYTALAMGSLPLASKVGSKLLGFGTSRGQKKLMSDNLLERQQGAEILKSSWWKGMYSGTNGFTNNNLTTTPFRQHINRGGASRVFGEKLRKAQEDSNTSIAVSKAEFRSVMATHKIKPGEGELVAQLMAKTIKETDPLVMPRHIAAAKAMRAIYNRELDELVKVKVLTKAEATAMKNAAEAEGYLNRIYYTDYLRTKKGSTEFHAALSRVEMKESEAVDIISALTGDKRKDAIERLREYSTKDGAGFITFTHSGVRKMLQGSVNRGAQPARFIERERKLPTKLEKVLEPFLVRDLDTAFTKYTESAARRREYARQFGPNGELARGYAEQIGKEWKSSELRNMAMQDYWGATFDPRNKWLADYFNQSQAMRSTDVAIQHFQNAKLIASAPINFTQHLVYLPAYMAKMGMTSKIPKAMFKAYGGALKEISEEFKMRGKVEGRGFINTVGSMTDMMTYNATGEALGSDGGAKLGMWKRLSQDPGIWLKASGFSHVENWNRRVSGLAGKFIVEDTLNRFKYITNKAKPSRGELKELEDLRSRMVDMGLDPDIPEGNLTIGAVKDAGDYVGGVLRDWNEPEAIAAGAQRISNEVNFKSGYMDKPRWWNTPIGKWFGKFRSFVLHSHHFITDNILKPINEGNTMPLAIFLTAGGAVAPITEIKELLKNDDIERTGLSRFLHSTASVGTTGMMGEGIRQVMDYPQGAGNFIMGPVFSDAGKVANSVFVSANEGDIKKLAIDLSKMLGPVPYAAGVVTRATGEDNPLATQQERDRKERAKNLRVAQPTGYSGYEGY